ncbi:MAG: Fic family protein [Rickettsiales bacterium]|jgi:Fic family protein|nr:Fic family protein [Rickettsiales bacterium]
MSKYEPVYKITPEIMNLVYKIAGDLEWINIIRDQVLTPQLRRENRIKTIHSSLYIEANSLSLEQVSDVINGKKVSGPKRDIAEVKNAFAAYQKLLERNPYKIDDLLEQHKILMAKLVDNPGKFRAGDVGVFAGAIPVHIAPPADRVFGLMSELLKWTKKSDLPQVLKSCIFHYEFEFIHPFADGNGRMGRMWQTLLLYKENPIFGWLPVETLIAKRQMDYYNAIQESTSMRDSGIFTKFMLGLLSDALTDFCAEQNATVNATVNKTSDALLAVLRGNPYATYDDLAKSIGKDRKTIARAIAALKDKKIIERVGSDKTGYWKILEK